MLSSSLEVGAVILEWWSIVGGFQVVFMLNEPWRLSVRLLIVVWLNVDI